MNTPVPIAVVEALHERVRCHEGWPSDSPNPAIPIAEALPPPDQDRRDKPGDDEPGARLAPVPIAVVAALRERIRCLDGGARHRRAVLPFGVKAIDERLPEGGLTLGALHEVAGGGNGAIDGAAAALFAAGIAARTRGRVLWCVTRRDLFAPALASVGLAPERVIYVEAGDEKSLLACFEEGLRHGGSHGGLGAVVAEVARLSMTASRRLQLAAEGSGAIGVAIRRLPYRQAGLSQVAMPTFRYSPACWEGGGLAAPYAMVLHMGGRVGDVAPSPRLPSGRSRPSSTGYGEGRGEEFSPQAQTGQAQTRGDAPSPGICATSAQIPTSPRKRGEVRGRGQMRLLPPQGEDSAAMSNLTQTPTRGRAERGQAADFGQPTAAVTRWRVSALPSAPLPVPGIGRARWRLELIRCRGGESAEFTVEACDAQGRLALPSDLVDGSGQKTIGRRRTAR